MREQIAQALRVSEQVEQTSGVSLAFEKRLRSGRRGGASINFFPRRANGARCNDGCGRRESRMGCARKRGHHLHEELLGNKVKESGWDSTPHLAHVTRKHFFVCIVCVISRNSHHHRRISCRTCNIHDLTAFLFLFPQHSVSTPYSGREYPLQSATRSSVWTACRTEPVHKL